MAKHTIIRIDVNNDQMKLKFAILLNLTLLYYNLKVKMTIKIFYVIFLDGTNAEQNRLKKTDSG